uniref:Uncharacterized protein n=1 Tax=Anopheles farauti TaxID=69004 RepID=A0A182Q7T5_9DIPT
MVFCSCSFLAWYLFTAIVSYVAVYVVQVVLDLPLWEGQQQHHSPSDQHFELKRLIQKILEEIAKLPELLNHSGLPLRPEEHLPYFDPKKYEQLLATAVLNKVVDDYRNPKNFTDGGDVAGKSTGAAKPYGTVDINHNQLTETVGGGEQTLCQMSVAADEVLPHESVSYSATGERRLSDDTDESYLSDYIQHHKVPLPDLSDTTGSGSGAEDDDLQSLKSNATDGTWEENWLFRKRQLKTTESSIAMLVPSPTEEVKALIGDKNADEISDLSEAGSDCEGYESDGAGNGGKDSSSAPVAGVPIASSSKDTSEGISSSSKTHDSLEEEHMAPDSLVSINSLPVNEEPLLETRNSHLLAEQSPARSGALSVDDLISMEPVAVEKVETTNPFLDDVFEPNNNVITDDVKLLQRTEAGDSRVPERTPANGYGDRKEIPIDRAPQQQHPTHSNISPSNPVAESVVIVAADSVADSSSSSSSSIPGNGASDNSVTDSVASSKNTNKPEPFEHPEVSQQLLQLQSLSPPGSPVQQPVLSPHPIMMTITDVFDRLANSSPLTAISEEQPPALLLDVADTESMANEITPAPAESSLEAISEESESIKQEHTMLAHADSMQTEHDESEYRTISEATNHSLALVGSFDALESFDAPELPNESSLAPAPEEEYRSLGEHSDPDRTTEPSPDLLQIRETPPAAIYVRSQDQLEFAEQLKQLDLNTAPEPDPFESDDEAQQPAQITMQSDLVTFDNNAPSPEVLPGIAAVTEQMRAYCEELKGILNRPAEEESNEIDQLPAPEHEQWELVESPEVLDALAVFQNDLLIAVNDPTQSDVRACKDHPIRDEPFPAECFPSPVEVAGLQMADYSDSLKNIEFVEEAEVMEPDRSIRDNPLPVESFPSPVEVTGLQMADGSNSLKNVQYVEEAEVVEPDRSISDEPFPEECFPSPVEVAGLQMADCSNSLKNIEYVEEAEVMEDEPMPLPESSIEPDESSQALLVTSPKPSHHIVTVTHTPSSEQPSTTALAHDNSEETMLASIESRSESKIDDTSMPFSDTELPSLSSPFTSFSNNTPTTASSTTTTTTTVINNCMSTNLTADGRASSPSPSIETNPSNSKHSLVESDVSLDESSLVGLSGPQETTADACSIVAAQKAEETPLMPATNGDGGQDQEEASLDLPDTLIPGSIAEREHLKWRNAKPIANNPYSPDALQRRLSEKARPASMIEIDRLVRKEVAPVAIDDEETPPKEAAIDSGTENDRSLQSVTGGIMADQKKIGREYYINDPERLRSGGVPAKQTLGLPQHQQSHSTDDEKVSHQTYYTLPTDSYIMDRFLNNAPVNGGSGMRSTTVGRSPSTRSNRSLPQNELAAIGGSLHRAASVDLGYQTKTPSAAGSDTAVDIPAHILAQFEQETLHSDYKRDSFRARHATTRQFVLNPIFDEQSSPGPDGTVGERAVRPGATLPRKSVSCRRIAPAETRNAPRTSSGAVVETVFTDLGTLRRSASVKSRIEQFSGPFAAIRRTDSYRSTLSK